MIGRVVSSQAWGGRRRRHTGGASFPLKFDLHRTDRRLTEMDEGFETQFYLDLVNSTYSEELSHKLTPKSFTNQNPRIVKRIEDFFKSQSISEGRFNHYRPAVYLLKGQSTLLKKMDPPTIDRAAALFSKINALLQ